MFLLDFYLRQLLEGFFAGWLVRVSILLAPPQDFLEECLIERVEGTEILGEIGSKEGGVEPREELGDLLELIVVEHALEGEP